MTKELTTTQSKEIAAATDLGAWDDFDGGSSELVIPKALLMQGLSDLVADGKAAIGEYRNSLTGELLAAKGDKLSLIPFHFSRYWAVAEKNGNKFRRIEEINASNEKLPWDFTDSDGTECKRTYTRSFYCLKADDVDGLPLVINFSSTAASVGQKMWTQMYVMNRQAGKIPCAFELDITAATVKGEKGTYASPSFVRGKEVSGETAVKCREWLQSIKSGAAKADVSDEAPKAQVHDPGTHTAAGEPADF